MPISHQPAVDLQNAGYRKVPSVKNDPRLVPYWQRWEGDGGLDFFEFPHDLPIELVAEIILDPATQTIGHS